ncbi:hypothetical protein HZH68_002814 [Vespula germanica]|uniref:ADAM10 cysteine-rich domain-containing protein n=1 Tax=Vespula germanica TaxID=30212 RepID=A0A834NN05_VESGE|nr:hypothetical protein HZH68_002814 [Vespula germanica]
MNTGYSYVSSIVLRHSDRIDYSTHSLLLSSPLVSPECTGSICLAYGLESCQCIAGPEDPPTKSCELCCKLPGEDQPCLSSFTWNSAPYDIPDMLSKPGTPCNDYNGYCDIFQKCREVDPSGPLATLRRLLLSDASLANFQRWIIDRWFTIALIILFLLSILCVVTRLLSKRRIPRIKILPTSQETREIARREEFLSKDDATSNVTRIRSMNISHIKKRIVEAMKSIVSPRGKRNDEESLRASTCISRILCLLEKDATRAVDRSEKQSLNEIEEVEGKRRRSRSEKKREKRRKEMEEEELKKKENRRTLVPRVECQEKGRNLGRWRRISFLLSGRTIPSNLTISEEKITTNSYNVESGVRKNSTNYQSEPLVVPDTPDTPIDTVEGRMQTSDLTPIRTHYSLSLSILYLKYAITVTSQLTTCCTIYRKGYQHKNDSRNEKSPNSIHRIVSTFDTGNERMNTFNCFVFVFALAANSLTNAYDYECNVPLLDRAHLTATTFLPERGPNNARLNGMI